MSLFQSECMEQLADHDDASTLTGTRDCLVFLPPASARSVERESAPAPEPSKRVTRRATRMIT